MIRAVVDTNTLVAAFINPKGYPAQLLSAWHRGEFQVIISPVIAQDLSDDKFFVAAVEGEANYIITKEQAWKKLKTYRGIRIVSPSKFYEILQKLKKN